MQTNWTSNTITVNGKSIHYTRTGNGKKQSLVLVHGFSDNGLCWAKTARYLEHQFDIIMPDSYGHGQSSRIQQGDDMVDNAADLACLLSALELAKPIIAGHSMGAASASELGARFPELPGALILEDPPWGMQRPAETDQETGSVNPVFEWAKTLEGKSVDELVEVYKPQHPSWDPEVLTAWCLGKTQLDQNFLSINSLFRMNWMDIVEGIKCPTLLITADQPGGIVSSVIAEKAVTLNNRIEHVHVPGTGHHIRFENYDAFFNAFTDFLRKINA